MAIITEAFHNWKNLQKKVQNVIEIDKNPWTDTLKKILMHEGWWQMATVMKMANE